VKLAVQENLLPGETFAEKAAIAEDLGFAGIEVWGNAICERVKEIKSALRGRRLKVSTVCDGLPGALLVADAEARRACRQGILDRLRAAAEFGAVGLIVVPVFNHQWDLPDLSPLMTAQELGESLLVAQLKEMAPEVGRIGGPCILLEPLNRYEARFLTRQAKAVELIRRVNSAAVHLLCDFFHMNIEEPDIPAAIKKAGSMCRHIHLADNTRMEPGSGSINFKAAFAALKGIGFDGYMALECGFTGEPRTTLARTVEFLRSQM
jgi:sugar phosphate isomerase/epimerase